jgi:hypothetical protein
MLVQCELQGFYVFLDWTKVSPEAIISVSD